MPGGIGGSSGPSGTGGSPSSSNGGARANTGGGSGLNTGAGTSGGAASAGRAGMGATDAGFMVTEEMTEDMDAATEAMAGNEFIFDVQTHTATEFDEPWDGDTPPDERALDFITQIFVQSETDVAVLSGPPGARALGGPNVAAREQVRELIDRLAGPRLLIHGNTELERGASELDYMAELAELYHPAAWKVYPHEGDLLLDSDELGGPFIEAARSLGILMVAGHRGLWDNGGFTANSSPRDMVRAATAAPDIDFLIYHSGYERMNDENHPYDAMATEHFGVDRMVRALAEEGIGADGNVYAELGSTWVNIMTEPEQAAHVLGKLLVALGPDRILWGTDCVYNGIPQSQIVAMRMFQIPESMQEEFGYPALSQETKEKIFGLNAARIYGVDVGATRSEIDEDDVTALRTAFLQDPNSLSVPDRQRYEGPRTRRDFLRMLERDRFFGHG
jgi:predicted TIM-barrel fold metal-dependent hydrolase